MLPNIFIKPEILNKETHKELKMGAYENFNFTKNAYLVPIGLNEMSTAMKSLIVVFIKEQSGDISPAAVLGGEEGANLLVDEDGKWKDNAYIPAALRCYPFGIGESENNEKFISIDSEAELLKVEDGKRIFNDDMSETEHGKFAFKFVNDVYSQIEDAKGIAKELESYGLFKQANLELTQGEKKFTLNKGVYIIDENSLNKLESRKIKKIATKGILPFVYAHLFSLTNRY